MQEIILYKPLHFVWIQHGNTHSLIALKFYIAFFYDYNQETKAMAKSGYLFATLAICLIFIVIASTGEYIYFATN